MDPGALDSWSVRGWYRPGTRWTFQVSHGFLTNPEATDPGNLRRTTASASWTARRDQRLDGRHGRLRPQQRAWARLHRVARRSHARLRRHDDLRTCRAGRSRDATCCASASTSSSAAARRTCPKASAASSAVGAFTVGGLRTIARPSGWDLAAGADVTGLRVPAILKPLYGDQPVSFHVFFRLRPPAPMGRMMDMTMTSGDEGHVDQRRFGPEPGGAKRLLRRRDSGPARSIRS